MGAWCRGTPQTPGPGRRPIRGGPGPCQDFCDTDHAPALQYNPTNPMRRAPSPPPSDRAGLCSQPLRGLVTFLPASPCAGRPSRPQAPRLEAARAARTPRMPRRLHTFPDLQLRLLSLKEGRRGGVASKWEADSAAALF